MDFTNNGTRGRGGDDWLCGPWDVARWFTIYAQKTLCTHSLTHLSIKFADFSMSANKTIFQRRRGKAADLVRASVVELSRKTRSKTREAEQKASRLRTLTIWFSVSHVSGFFWNKEFIGRRVRRDGNIKMTTTEWGNGLFSQKDACFWRPVSGVGAVFSLWFRWICRKADIYELAREITIFSIQYLFVCFAFNRWAKRVTICL